MAFDGNGDYVYLAPNRVNLQMAQERFPDIRFLETREIYRAPPRANGQLPVQPWTQRKMGIFT
ncbi:hypothetical protein [Zoogloea sp.]|uniref:hypothetical protein n=1 Tax=Zoogloea sp. TaxID=49181 RepID=UPI0035B084F9